MLLNWLIFSEKNVKKVSKLDIDNNFVLADGQFFWQFKNWGKFTLTYACHVIVFVFLTV